MGFFGVRGGGWWVAAAVTVLAGCTKRPPPEALGSTSAELTCAPSLTTRVDVANDGSFSLDFGLAPSVSADARYVAFSSLGSTLAPGGASGRLDVYVRDRLTSQTTRASVSSTGAALNAPSSGAKLSGDGRFVLFETNATNVVGTSTAGITHVYVRDIVAGTTERISVSSAGGEANASSGAGSVSADGRFVAFESSASNLVSGDTGGFVDVFLMDRSTHTVSRVSETSGGTGANGDSFDPAVSADGSFVAFATNSTNLTSGDTNSVADVLIWNRSTRQSTRLSVSTAGAQSNGRSAAPAISQDGALVAFESDATNLVAGDTNAATDVFVRDRTANQTVRVSVSSTGTNSDGASFGSTIGGDGRLVGFASDATNLVAGAGNHVRGIYIRDRTTSQTTRADITSTSSPADAPSDAPKLATNGKAVVFQSASTNLTPAGVCHTTDIYARDLVAAPTTWKTGVAYAVGVLVTYAPNGHTYQCIQAHTSQADRAPPNVPALWQSPTPCGVQPWVTQTIYVVGSLVTFGGKTYRCIQAHTSQVDWTPPVVPNLWQVV